MRPAGQVAERGDILLQLRRGVGQRVVRVHADADDVPPVGQGLDQDPRKLPLADPWPLTFDGAGATVGLPNRASSTAGRAGRRP